MATRSVTLTNVPQLITAKAAYMESQGGDFHFVFSTTTPASVTANHKDRKLYVDGTLGPLYAWKSNSSEVLLIVSEAI